MTNILLADDDEALCALLADYLALDGFSVTAIHRGDDVVDALRDNDFALLILDIMLPGAQGFEVLRAVRDAGLTIPVIMLTARGDDTDRIVGLELGADDYLPKPCNPRELSARIKAVLRRGPAIQADAVLHVGPFTVDPARYRATFGETALTLTTREFDLLLALLRRPDTVISKSELSELVLKRPLEDFDRSLDMHVSHLRKKIAEHSDADYIITVRGVGYRLDREGT